MWIARTRISRTHNLAEQNERRISQLVFLQDRIERNIFAVVSELALRHVEHDSILDLCPISFVRKKNKFRLRIDKFCDQPRARNPIDFNFLASDPSHGSGMPLLRLSFKVRIKSSGDLLWSVSAMVSEVSLSKPARHCRSCFILQFFGSPDDGTKNSA